MRIRVGILLLTGSLGLWAQHGSTPEAAQVGEGIFQSTCARCHGVEGDGVSGVNLLKGQFKRVANDADLSTVIVKGVPGTAMPPGNYNPNQVKSIVAYLHSSAESAKANAPIPGNAANGKLIVEGKGKCLNCHRVDGTGGVFGPDLTDIGLQRTFTELQQSLVDPSAEIRVENRVVQATKKDGTTVTGRLLNMDGFSMQLADQKGKLISLQKSDLKSYSVLDKSPMPSFKGRLTDAEIGDVVNYLHTLKGAEN